MKRCLILSCLFLLFWGTAGAEGADIQCPVPNEIADFFSASTFDKTTITAYTEISGTPSGAYAFAIGKGENRTMLYGFSEKEGKWTYRLVTNGALPQANGTFTLSNNKVWQMQPTGKNRSVNNAEPVLNIQWLSEDQKTQYNAIYSTQGTSGQWRLRYACQASTGKQQNFDIRVDPDGLLYLDGGDIIGKAYGTVQDNLRYHKFAALPQTLEDARNKITVAPELGAQSPLQEQPVTFVGGQKYAVYSGPGTDYFRAANGKAVVSTNDWIQVFGTDGDFVFIQYAIDSQHMRFGYIDSSSLPKGTALSPCPFTPAEAEIAANADVTDDPLNSAGSIFTLKAGDQVTLLTTLENYAYVEGVNENVPFRGFVPLDKVQRLGPDWQSTATASYGQNASITATLTLKSGHISLQGQANSSAASDLLGGYQLFAHQVLLAEDTTLLSAPLRSSQSQHLVQDFSFSCELPAGARLITLCPLSPSGEPDFDHCIQFILPERQ